MKVEICAFSQGSTAGAQPALIQGILALTLFELISPVKNFGVAIAVTILHQTELAVFATTMFMAQLPSLR